MTHQAGRPQRSQTSTELPYIRQPNLKTQVHDLLLEMIIEGRYKSNDMLPPERILCEELGVSRTVVREAIKTLESRGVLKVIHGKGIQVVPSSSSDISSAFMLYLRRQHREVSLKDLIVVRFAVETEIARQAALNASAEEIDHLGGLLDQNAGQLSDKQAYIATDLEFHLHMSYATHNILLIAILEALLIPLRRSLSAMGSVQDNRESQDEHREVFRRLEVRDSEGAKQMMAKHLEHVERSLRAGGQL